MQSNQFALECYASFDALPDYVRQFIDDHSPPNLYLSRAWFENMAAHGLEASATLRLYCLEEMAQSRCHALLALRSPAGQNGSRIAQWPIHASSLASLTNFQTSFFAPMFAANGVPLRSLCQHFAAGLGASHPAWHLLDLNLMDPESDSFEEMAGALSGHGFRCERYPYKGNWYERLSCTTFDEYLKSRGKSSRKAIQNYQRKARKLERENRMQCRVFGPEDDLATIMEAYAAIYDDSDKQVDYFPGFYEGLIRRSHSSGSLRMVVVYLDGHPAAFEYAAVTGHQCVMMRTAYVARYRRESVGSIAIQQMIQHVIEHDGVQEIDFGTDDDAYKSTWVTQRRERYGLLCFNRTPLGRFYALLYDMRQLRDSLAATMKRLLRSARGR